ncbi:MAG TPA: transcriptional repressor LexA [Gammaproteobacteria bacterium]|nr:transcriptional repressor LexA [Gammaproteobacteria bacterium]
MENTQAGSGPPLTRRQQALYEHLLARQTTHLPAPTLEDLCRELGLRSRGSLHKQVQALVAAGLVEPMAGRQRGVRLTAGAPRSAGDELPWLGYIAAGRPIEAVPNAQPVPVPPALRTSRPCYVLEVRGDSMVDEGILDGDRVVIEQRDSARNGEIVVALVDGEEATLKRIEQRPGQVILHPANPAHAPQRYRPDQITLQGVLVGLMRSYR